MPDNRALICTSNFFKLLLVTSVVVVTIAVYWPALYGWFIFDDIPNLSSLTHIRDQFSWGRLIDFSLDGKSSLLGRPIALLTFGLQADYWFRDAFPFKLVNLFIHCVNGLLVLAIAHKIFNYLKVSASSSVTFFLALIVSLVWLLHPMNVSSVAYVVQRMALLSTLFVLLAVYLYIATAIRYSDCRFTVVSNKALFFRGLCVFVLMILGILSKENAALLPLGLLVLQGFILNADKNLRSFRWGVIFLPLLLGCLGFLLVFNKMVLEGYSYRDFTLVERLLTQSRMLFQYLYVYFSPISSNLPFFNDHIIKSESLFNPPTTFVSSLSWVGLAFLGIWKRAKWPLFSFGVFWYLAFHVLESSFFPLELYYEHRSYLPSIGLSIALVGIIYQLIHVFKTRGLKLAGQVLVLATALWIIGLIILCLEQTTLWGSPLKQSYFWYEKNQQSLRAADHYGVSLLNAGLYKEAENVFQEMENLSARPIGSLNRFQLACMWAEAKKPDMNDLYRRTVDHGKYKRVINYIGFLIDYTSMGHCQGLNFDDLLQYISKLKMSDKYANAPLLHKYEAVIYGEQGKWLKALESINKAVMLEPKPPFMYDIELDRINVWLALGYVGRAEYVIGYLNANSGELTTRQQDKLSDIMRSLDAVSR